jgi:hypothetical protein
MTDEDERMDWEAAAGMRPRMSRAEVALLRAFEDGKAQVVEYGCGGSTVLSIRLAQRVISVEADQVWIERTSAHPAIAEALGSGKLRLLHADIGPIGTWSRPLDPSTAPQWPEYWEAPWRLLRAERRLPRRLGGIRRLLRSPEPAAGGEAWVVLVDGRFRVACALHAALWIGPGDVVLIHDFWPRKPYHVILKYFVPIARAETMVALSLRPEIPRRTIARALARYATDPR